MNEVTSMARTKPTARMSTSGSAPRRQHSLLAKRVPMNILFDWSDSDTSDTEDVEESVHNEVPKASTGGTKYPPFVPRKKNTTSGIPSIQACREIAGAKRSLNLVKNWNHGARANLEAAEQRLKEAKNQLRDAQNAVTQFKLQLSETIKGLDEETLNVATIEEKHCVINLESDCDVNKCDDDSDSDSDSYGWSTRTVCTNAKVTPANSSAANLS